MSTVWRWRELLDGPRAQFGNCRSQVQLLITERGQPSVTHAWWCWDGRTMQTGTLLAALAQADVHGEWERVWPSHDGKADQIMADAEDAHPSIAARWNGVALSADLVQALELLVELTRRHGMDPIQPGAVALALAAQADTDRGTAARSPSPTGKRVPDRPREIPASEVLIVSQTGEPARTHIAVVPAGLLACATCTVISGTSTPRRGRVNITHSSKVSRD